MKMLLFLWGLMGPLFLSGPGFEEAVLVLTGASCIEDLSEEELLRWEALAAHPADLNMAGRSRLMASGLLSQFQVASLLDYRGRTGAVLSWSELALVDGFTPEIVEALKVFATLGPAASGGVGGASPPGHRESLTLDGSVTLKGGWRPGSGSGTDGFWEGAAYAGGVKLEAALGERAALFLSARNTLSDARFKSPTFSAAYYGWRALGQVVVGHFNARFGQGLVLWSGFRMSGYSSIGAFRRNGNGFSPTGSYSPSLLGVASDWHFGPWRLSAAYFINDKLPILNLTRTGRTSTFGLTATSRAAGFEARWSLPGGWSLFGEVASEWAAGKAVSSSTTSLATVVSSLNQATGTGAVISSNFRSWLRTVSAVAGAVRVPSYGYKWALLGRWFWPGSKEYSGLALGYAGPSLETTLDAGCRLSDNQLQIKSVTQWKPVFELAAGPLLLRPQLRLIARWRPELSPSSTRTQDLRLELRGVLAAEYGPWLLSGRYDAVWYRDFAWSWYAEAGRKTDASWAVYLRGGIFKVDNWDDRIYVYERDAPGSFTVPARYGRGWNASLYAAWHLPRRARPGRSRSRHSLWQHSPSESQALIPGSTRDLQPGSSSSGAVRPASSLPSRHSVWLRLETVQYPWNLTPKPARLEARLQYRYKF